MVPAPSTPVTGSRPDRTSDHPSDGGERWAPRPVLAAALRATVVALPVGVAVLASLGVEHVLPLPAGAGHRVLWWLGTLAVATVAATTVERFARRLLPLAVLLRMTLLFPDRAPSRFKLARASASPARLAELAAEGADERSVAAGQVLALLSRLSRHDRHTRGHSERVRVFSDLVAEQLGVEGLDRDKLRWGALLHDIGKISVPAAVLNKRGRPTPEEWSVLQAHPAAGEELAGPLTGWLGPWAGAITEHHERWDGQGYPTGRRAEELTLGGRIVAVADAYETMTATRSYKKPMATAAARRELSACAGGQFDPEVVRAFLLISLPKVARALGPLSWLVHLPFAARLQAVGLQAAAGAGSLGAPVAALGVSTMTAAAVTMSGATATVAVTDSPAVAAATGGSHPAPGLGHAASRGGSLPAPGGPARSAGASTVPLPTTSPSTLAAQVRVRGLAHDAAAVASASSTPAGPHPTPASLAPPGTPSLAGPGTDVARPTAATPARDAKPGKGLWPSKDAKPSRDPSPTQDAKRSQDAKPSQDAEPSQGAKPSTTAKNGPPRAAPTAVASPAAPVSQPAPSVGPTQAAPQPTPAPSETAPGTVLPAPTPLVSALLTSIRPHH